MGADWYSCISFFGYIIKVPDNVSYRKFVKKLFGLDSIIEKPFKITGMLQEFHSRMEYASESEIKEMDDYAILILGFNPPSDITELSELAKKLSEFVIDNPILNGLTLSEKPNFFAGIDWFDNIDIHEDTDDYDDDDDDDDEDEYDEDDDDDDDDDN